MVLKHIAIAVSGVLALGVAGCQRDDDAMVKKLDEISTKLDKLGDIERRIAASGAPGGARPSQPAARPGRPVPSAVYSVPVEANDPFVGPADAPVTIVKGFEFACPFCQRVIPTLDKLHEEYGDKVRVVYKDYIVHPQSATTPALAACAAHKQGKYKQMYNQIWEKGFNANRNLSAENMEKIAKDIGLNMNKFKSDMNGEECKKAVQVDQAQLAAVGTRGTPSFYINGRHLSGAQPYERFKALVDEELKKAEAAIKGGAKAADYYQKNVVEKGEKKI